MYLYGSFLIHINPFIVCLFSLLISRPGQFVIYPTTKKFYLIQHHYYSVGCDGEEYILLFKDIVFYKFCIYLCSTHLDFSLSYWWNRGVLCQICLFWLCHLCSLHLLYHTCIWVFLIFRQSVSYTHLDVYKRQP